MDDGPRLTRRGAIGGAAAAGAGLLLGRPGPAAAVARGSGARGADDSDGDGSLVTRAVGTLPAGVAVSLAPGRPFTLAAVRWRAPADPRIELRARPAGGGAWGPWRPAGVQGHDGDGVAAAGHAGEGVLTGDAGELQLRAGATVHGVSARFVPAQTGPGPRAARAAALPYARSGLDAGAGQPPILARAAWAGGGHRPSHRPEYGSVQMAFVHHTEGPDGYSRESVPGMLRSIYAFHRHGRGWWDIGYNFVVDRFGQIWEAREGGVDLPVIGAQAGDWNTLSTGVAILGSYQAGAPSAAALDALERLLAWKLSLHGVPATGELDAVVSGAAVSYTRFRAGERVRLPRIAGHRDGDATSCPGDALYHRLPDVRGRTRARAASGGSLPQLALRAELAATAAGVTLTLTGSLTRDGRGVGAAAIAIEDVGPGRRVAVASATTAEDGSFTATVAPSRALLLRAVHRSPPAVVSELVDVRRPGHSAAG